MTRPTLRSHLVLIVFVCALVSGLSENKDVDDKSATVSFKSEKNDEPTNTTVSKTDAVDPTNSKETSEAKKNNTVSNVPSSSDNNTGEPQHSNEQVNSRSNEPSPSGANVTTDQNGLNSNSHENDIVTTTDSNETEGTRVPEGQPEISKPDNGTLTNSTISYTTLSPSQTDSTISSTTLSPSQTDSTISSTTSSPDLTDATTTSPTSSTSTTTTMTTPISTTESAEESTVKPIETTNVTSPTTMSTTMITPDGASSPNTTTSRAEAEPPKTDIHSGVVALVMAITFAVVVIIVYFGLLAWRRYLECRYGNRELLVNDLEFDTSDLRHFEL